MKPFKSGEGKDKRKVLHFYHKDHNGLTLECIGDYLFHESVTLCTSSRFIPHFPTLLFPCIGTK